MPYDTNIPRATDNLNVSQGDIQGNFLTANTIMAINHYPFDNTSADKGKHKFVDMPILAALPSIASGDGGLYTKTVSSQSQLFYAADGNITEYQMTRVIPASVGTFATNPGWTFLPGGLIMQYGSKSNPGTSGSVLFTPNIDFPTACFYVFLQLQHSSSGNESATVQPTPTTTGFSYRTTSSGASTILYWWAIGN